MPHRTSPRVVSACLSDDVTEAPRAQVEKAAPPGASLGASRKLTGFLAHIEVAPALENFAAGRREITKAIVALRSTRRSARD